MIREIKKGKGVDNLLMGIFLVFTILFNRCNQADHQTPESTFPIDEKSLTIRFAEGFRIEKFPGYKRISILNPWQGAEDIVIQYYLVNRDSIPTNLPLNAVVIKTPVKRIICTSTTHIGMLDYLEKLNTVVGVSGKKYINNEWVLSQSEEGKIIDIGYDQNINFEAIVALKPDLVMTYGVGSEIAAYTGKLKDLGIPVIINGDYLEQSPLAKSEWIKVVAALYNMETEATEGFDHITKEYQEISKMTLDIRERPDVMIGLPWKDVWYIPGANSFAANFIHDAGGSYIWGDKSSNEAIPLSLEAVFEKGKDADIWINPGTAESLNEIIRMDERLSSFQPFNQNRIYNNNRVLNPSGGNDYWESGIMNPHKILADLVKIFHPEVLPEHQFVYYKKLN